MKNHVSDSPVRFIRYFPNDPLATRPELERVPAPDPSQGSLRVRLVPAGGRLSPPASYPPGSQHFLEWQLIESLRRGIQLWTRLVPGFRTWQGGRAELEVIPDDGEDLNAYYDRAALHFFHRLDPVRRQIVLSGASVDVACHEQGHAVLDALRPDLWSAASFEISAFHESFGDMSALLVVLEDERIRANVLAETRGRLTDSNDASRLAEQLGQAVRDLYGADAAPAGCLRDAANEFTYISPAKLPPRGSHSVLTREAHSFSRVFTGAFYETLARTAAGLSSPVTTDALLAAAHIHGAAMARAVILARRGVNWMGAVASAWLGSLEAGPAHEICLDVLTRRKILARGRTTLRDPVRWDERGQFLDDLRASGRLIEGGRVRTPGPALPTHALLGRSGRPLLHRLRIE